MNECRLCGMMIGGVIGKVPKQSLRTNIVLIKACFARVEDVQN